ncbi:unnamed protein product [Arctia plantaginis]|uniref:Uncharacterized protein n=1 Tax=Arctia plantaginis TaxID=874455 RepID=A0A8S0YUN3_ARCPL|nr:unnamed protein product [Arctia plantaginis]
MNDGKKHNENKKNSKDEKRTRKEKDKGNRRSQVRSNTKWRWAGHLARYIDKRWTVETTIWKRPMGKRKRSRREAKLKIGKHGVGWRRPTPKVGFQQQNKII